MDTTPPGPRPPEFGDRLVGWKAIAAHLNISPRTAARWADAYGLPVQRVPRGTRPLVFAEIDELDRWWQSAAATKARRESAGGDEAAACSESSAGTDVASSAAIAKAPRSEGGEPYFPRTLTVRWVVVGVGFTLIAVAATWGVASRRASPRGDGLTLGSQLTEGAHGEAVSAQLVELRLTATGRPEATVQIAEGEMVRIETAKTRLGLQARQTGNRLTLLAYRLDPIGSGESATSIGSYSLSPRSQTAQIEVNGERAAVAWSGPLGVQPRRAASREPCCMVCKGVTFCGQVVSANCGSCRGNELPSDDKGR